MARPLRIEFEGALYHVMSRGNERRAIVKDDVDRRRRVDWLGRTVETYGWRLHAFVLMDNHDHLFVETPEANLSAGMQFLNGSYTGYYNHRHGRSGHLFQGRYKAQLIENEGYYLEVSRYIHLNPVRAGRVGAPEEWRWGSYRGYHRAAWEVPWVTYGQVLGEFSRGGEQARRGYRRFVGAGIGSPPRCPWKEAAEGLIVGGELFVERVKQLLSDRPEDRSIPAMRVLRTRPPLERIAAESAGFFGVDTSRWAPGHRVDDRARAVAAFLARRKYGYRVVEIVRALGYTSNGGVTGAIRRVECSGGELSAAIEAVTARLAKT
ncbi:MAG: transposase [Phycisphaerae bacterium]|nr:transposase [Phycisphaerae bacterium]